MPLSRPQTPNHWFSRFGRYMLSPEAIGLYILSGAALYGLSKNTSLVDAAKDAAKDAAPAIKEGSQEVVQQNSAEMNSVLSKLLVAFHRYPQIMIPAAASIFSTTLTAFYQRYSLNAEEENRQFLQEMAKLRQDMDLHQKNADVALNRQDYFFAYKQLRAAGNIAKQLYEKTTHQTEADVYITCVIGQAQALYDLRKYEQALTLLETLLNDQLITHSLLHKAVLNLSGLIAYKQGSLPIYDTLSREENTYLVKARDYLSQSYDLDSSQNSVYFYIRYLQGGDDNYQYIAENIPTSAFNPTIYLPVPTGDVLHLDMFLLFADALFKHKQYGKSVSLYESLLEHIDAKSNVFVELAYLHILCFRGYAALIREANGNNVSVPKVQAEIDNEVSAEMVIALKSHNHTTDELRERAQQLLNQARIYLKSELFINNNLLECAKLHMLHAHTHLALAQVIALQIVAPFTEAECYQKAREEFQKAEALLKQFNIQNKRKWIFSPDLTEHNNLSQELARGMAMVSVDALAKDMTL